MTTPGSPPRRRATGPGPQGQGLNYGGRQLTPQQTQELKARLAKDGKAICDLCKRVGPARDTVCVMFRGNIGVSMCPDCIMKKAILVHPVDGDKIAIKLVDPDRATPPDIMVAPANVKLPSMTQVFGPTVEKREY